MPGGPDSTSSASALIVVAKKQGPKDHTHSVATVLVLGQISSKLPTEAAVRTRNAALLDISCLH